MPRIEDFGEKIAGARKDLYTQWREIMHRSAVEDIAEQSTLAKIWPEPDYSKSPLPPMALAWLRGLRDVLPSKPRADNLTDFLRWKLITRAHLRAAEALINAGEETLDFDGAQNAVVGAVRDLVNQELPSRLTVWHLKEGLRNAARHAKAYVALGHGTSLKRVEFWVDKRPGTLERQYGMRVREKAREPWREYLAGNWSALFEAFKADRLYHPGNQAEHEAGSPERAPIKLYLTVLRGQNIAFISARHHGRLVHLKKFATAQEAKDYTREPANLDTLRDRFKQWRETPSERNAQNAPRQGRDWRGGETITPEKFLETFGFRGVQFGNYVQGPRRQADLNNAYDALMDLAQTCGMAPRALSLDGTLGLSFGARGRGGRNAAAAHYEPGEHVINLTKGAGPGSLAHEWFHAFDHHIWTLSRPALSRRLFLTEDMNIARQFGMAPEDRLWQPVITALGEVNHAMGARSVLLDARRGKPYWTQARELMARAFEASIKYELAQRGCRNDYLVNIVAPDQWEGLDMIIDGLALDENSDYPYPLEVELPEVSRAMQACVACMRQASETMGESFSFDEAQVHGWVEEAQQPVHGMMPPA